MSAEQATCEPRPSKRLLYHEREETQGDMHHDILRWLLFEADPRVTFHPSRFS